MKPFLHLPILALLFFQISTAHAQESVRAAGESSTVQIQEDVPSGIIFTLPASNGRSYCCSVFHSGGGATVEVMNISVPEGAVNRTSALPSLGSGTGGSRHCLINYNGLFTDRQVSNANFTLSGISPADSGVKFDMNCEETSLYGGFNTNANPFNFLEITNTSDVTITGRIFAALNNGDLVIDNLAFSVDANKRVDIDIHTPAGPAKFGSIRILHNGPSGSLIANTSFYKADLTLTDTVPAQPRGK